MIRLMTWTTPNGQKPAIMLEECGLEYELLPIDIGAKQQFTDEFAAINPNHKIPALVDGGTPIFESGAILVHLAERTGRFLPAGPGERAAVLSWSFWQVGGLGPMMGQVGHFANAAGDQSYAVERFTTETVRLFEVLEKRLSEATWLGGEEYSIADMMTWPWVSGGLRFLGETLSSRLPSITATTEWVDRIGNRPAVTAALRRLDEMVGRDAA